MRNKLFITALFALLSLCSEAAAPVKVACVGNSITAGVGVQNRDKDSYPMMLGQMLGKEYEVRNFGVSGRTMIQKERSYMKENAYRQALDYQPDILIIKLGTNDTNPDYWQYKKEFAKDMTTMIQAFRRQSPDVKVYLCYPITIYDNSRIKQQDKVLTEELIPMIDKVAKKNGAQTVDLHTPTRNRPEAYSDGLHPNEQGAHIIAKTLYKALTGKETAHEIQPFPGTKSRWKGYDRYDFAYKSRRTIVVCPRKAREGNPWIWRPAFFGAFAYADEALLKEGFHIVFHDMTHQYGSPAAVKAGTDFHHHMTTVYGLSPQVSLEGLSRGGYYALQWAIANPEKTACIYLDNPVCDMFSWPGKQRAKEWREFLKLWQLPDDLTPERFEGNPIHRLQALAAHRVPILAVCGDSDRTVPFADNMKLIREAYARLGGPVQLIMKPGADHHPHSLEQPEPIVDFIVSRQPAYRAQQHCHVRGSLQNSLIRFEREKKGRVVFFGGSITHMKGWHNLIEEQLRRRFPATDFEFIEAGIPSAGTTPHAFRMENDVLSHGPVDLLFVEGAVNDHTNGFSAQDQVRGMEGVVRHALEANPYTDIVMLHFVYDPFLRMFPQGQTPDVILNHERVANHYLIPSVDCAREVSERIAAGEFTWKDFGGVHPNRFGHKFYAAALQTLFDRMWALPAEGLSLQKHELPADKLDRYSYTRGKFIPLERAIVRSGWTLVPSWTPREKTGTREGFVNVPMLYTDRPGATFTCTFKGTAVGLFMACGPRSGTLEYSIDHGPFQSLDTYTAWSQRLYLPWLYVLAAELDNRRQHTLTVRLAAPKDGKGQGAEAVIRNIVVSE